MKPACVWGVQSNSSSNGGAGDAYVLNLIAMRNQHIGVLSNGSVRRIQDLNSPSFVDISLLAPGSGAQITGVCSDASGFDQGLLWSCTNKGDIFAHDFRAPVVPTRPACSAATKVFSMSCMDIGFAGTLLACGTEEGIDSKIAFWDARKLQAAPLGEYVESHSDSITAVKFQGQMFFSGSVDGLVCGFDVTQPNETSALVSVVNPNGACLKLGCFGSRGLYVTTSSETFHMFDYETAQTIASFDNDVMRGTGCRELLTERTRVPGAPQQEMEINYLIDALWEPKTQKLILLAGNSEGGAFGFEATLTGFQPLGPLTGVHTEVVRCARFVDVGQHGFNILTGAEDGKICLWKPEM